MKTILNHPHIGLLILAWWIADLAVPLLCALSRRLGALDHPRGHKAQDAPVPFVGGIAIFLALTGSLASVLRFTSVEASLVFFGLLLGALIALILGIADDFRPINAVVKLLALAAATLALAAFGIHVRILPHTPGDIPNLVLTLLWIAGTTSALNSIDNMDGAAAGVSAIAAGATFLIAWGESAETAQPWLSYMSIALVGACLGFLRYNARNARVYLGNNGSFLLGFSLATTLVFARWSEDALKSAILPCVILSVPLYDIALTTYLRWRRGAVRTLREAIVYCGHDHMAHRLVALGLSRTQAVGVIWGLGILAGGAALAITRTRGPGGYIPIVGGYAAVLTALGCVLARASVREVNRPESAPEAGAPRSRRRRRDRVEATPAGPRAIRT
ncbi:MAG: undecaprenyl/decaprenyl-phosphate alpha-N-acetylglucosaminyl 1-phosphate transferase [Planctomycetes bacterium]|nr:undecaprenyl/decaprenyl-phosphate alpha-N-acetylglucosaminyl 1-phosphate transferase [Planctomycetota bacterium]